MDDIDEATLRDLAAAHAESVFDKVEQRYRDHPDVLFDDARAEKAVGFFRRFIRHTQGDRAGQPFDLLAWQARLVRIAFGYRWRSTGLRVVRRVYLFVARKNGKSTFVAGLGILLLVGAGQVRAQVIGAAAGEDQAKIVFDEAAAMVAASDDLKRTIEVYKTGMQVPKLGAGYRVISARPTGKHGLNPFGILFDELHEQQRRDLYDALVTSVGAQGESLHLDATTAGFDRKTICWEVHEYAQRVRDGLVDDLSLLPVIFGADPGDDWRDPKTWAKGNPSLGHAIRLDYLRRECQRAIDTPGYQNTFRRLHCNEWTEQSSRWLDMAKWDASAGPLSYLAIEAAARGRTAFGGLDLAKVNDLSAYVLVIPTGSQDEPVQLVCRFWCPADDIVARSRRDRVPYDRWAATGLLIATEGNVTDFGFIREEILRLHQSYNIVDNGYDRTFGGEIVQELIAEGASMTQVGQGFFSMAAPTAEVERLVLRGLVHHGGHPILRWMAANVTVSQDSAGNLKPDKARSSEKIDGISGLCNALARRLVAAQPATSIFERAAEWQGDAAPVIDVEAEEVEVEQPAPSLAAIIAERYGYAA